MEAMDSPAGYGRLHYPVGRCFTTDDHRVSQKQNGPPRSDVVHWRNVCASRTANLALGNSSTSRALHRTSFTTTHY